jgi:hypothetical protein
MTNITVSIVLSRKEILDLYKTIISNPQVSNLEISKEIEFDDSAVSYSTCPECEQNPCVCDEVSEEEKEVIEAYDFMRENGFIE